MAEHNISNHPTYNKEPRIKLSDVKTKEDLMKFFKDYSLDREECCFCEDCLNSEIFYDTSYILTHIFYVMKTNNIFLENKNASNS